MKQALDGLRANVEEFKRSLRFLGVEMFLLLLVGVGMFLLLLVLVLAAAIMLLGRP